ncbi:MAG TPA: aldose 1-epimerase family protein [Planctomycetota bacterium]|nr:aldose 1-epimerase family protein [Planctomycetota bacterium]
MKRGTWTLTDVARGIWQDEFEVTSRRAGARRGPAWSIRKRTLRGGLTDGVEVVEVDNGAFAFTVLPTRGMGIWRGAYRGLDVAWNAPVVGPVHPKFVDPGDRGGLGWLQGFDEVIVRCGLESNGAPCTDVVVDNNGNRSEVRLPLHGRIANLPANRLVVEVLPGDPAELVVTGIVDESMLFGPGLRLISRVSTKAGSSVLSIDDRVENLRAIPSEIELLYHCNFGAPFLEAGSRLVAPAVNVSPRDPRAVEGIAEYDRYLGPTAGYVEQVYFYELAGARDGRTLAALVNSTGDKAAVVRFRLDEMPCLTQWKNTQALADGYVTGLEPGTNYPNPKPFERERGRVIRLAPGGSHRARLDLEILDSARAVSSLEREVAALVGGKSPKVHRVPRPEWSSAARKRR